MQISLRQTPNEKQLKGLKRGIKCSEQNGIES